MEVSDKLETLVPAAQFDVCGYDGDQPPFIVPLKKLELLPFDLAG